MKNQTNAKKTLAAVAEFLLLVIIVVGIPLYLFVFKRDFIESFESLEDVITFLQQNKLKSIFVYLMIQIVQIIISIIPGQVFQIAAGYLYHFIPGLILSVIGAVVGTSISFGIARVLGKNFVHLFFGEEKTKEYIIKLNSKQAFVIAFFLYMIPGLPKDVLSYIAGVSEMKFPLFLVASTLGRLPGMCASLLIGTLYINKHYYLMIAVAAIVVVLFIICIIKRKFINKEIDKLYSRISHQ